MTLKCESFLVETIAPCSGDFEQDCKNILVFLSCSYNEWEDRTIYQELGLGANVARHSKVKDVFAGGRLLENSVAVFCQGCSPFLKERTCQQ